MSSRPFADTHRKAFYESHGRECPNTRVRKYESTRRAYKVLFPGEPVPPKDLADPKWRQAQDAFDQDLVEYNQLIDEIKAKNTDIEHLFDAYLDEHYINPMDKLRNLSRDVQEFETIRTARMVRAFADGINLPQELRDPALIVSFIESGACAASIQGILRAREDEMINKRKDLPDGEGDNE